MTALEKKQLEGMMGELEAYYLFHQYSGFDAKAASTLNQIKSFLLQVNKGDSAKATSQLNELIDSNPLLGPRKELFQDYINQGNQSAKVAEIEKEMEDQGKATKYEGSDFQKSYGDKLIAPGAGSNNTYTFNQLYDQYKGKYSDEAILNAFNQIQGDNKYRAWNSWDKLNQDLPGLLDQAQQAYKDKMLDVLNQEQGTNGVEQPEDFIVQSKSEQDIRNYANNENAGITNTAHSEVSEEALRKAADLQNAEAEQANAAQKQAYNDYVQNAQAGINRSRAGLLGSQNESNQTQNVASQYQANRGLGTSTQNDYLEKMATANAAQVQADNMNKNSWMDTASGALQGMSTFMSDERAKEAPNDCIDDNKLKEAIKQFRQLKKRLDELKRNK